MTNQKQIKEREKEREKVTRIFEKTTWIKSLKKKAETNKQK